MAEKRFLKGLFKDTGNIDQPQGTWRHARNMILNDTDGAVSNEGGTIYSGTLPGGFTSQDYKVIGTIEVDDDRVILFLVDIITVDNPPTTAPRSEIGIWEAGVYTTILNIPLFIPTLKSTNDLNFRETHPIEGTFKISSKGELLIYWTDDLNPPRVLNVDRQQRESSATSDLYGVSHTNIDNINILNLFPYSGPVPHVELDDQGTHQGSVIEGGGLLTAVYYLALAYVDDEYVATNYLTVSNPISIVDEFDATTPTNKKDGARAGSQSTKAIKWDISNLNITYKYLRPVVIRSKGDAKEAYKLNDIEFSSSTVSVVFSGLETSAAGSVEEVIIDTIAYDTAKTIQQLDNILYLGNTTGSKDLGYQKYANNITLKSRIDDIEPFDEFYASVDNLETGWGYKPVNDFGGTTQTVDPTKSYRYAPNIFKWKGYMRDEVYAFYIAFVLNDGSMSYAYHIPGRKAVDTWDERDPVDTLSAGTYGTLWDDIHNTSPEYSKRFHWIDSRAKAISGGNWTSALSKQMNYWENATEYYPNTENYEVWDETGQLSGADGSIQGDNVRHHHFPSNRNSSRKSISTDRLCRTTTSDGSSAAADPWSGKFAYHYTARDGAVDGNGPINALIFDDDLVNPVKASFNRFLTGTNNLSTANAASQLFDGRVFTADQAMTVKVVARVWFEKRFDYSPGGGVQGSGGSGQMTPTWAYTNTNAIAALEADTSCTNPTPFVPDMSCGTACSPGTICAADAIGSWGDCSTETGSNDCDYNETGQITYNLQAGEQIWINAVSNPQATGEYARQARGTGAGNWGSHGCNCSSNHFSSNSDYNSTYTWGSGNDEVTVNIQCMSVVEFDVDAGSPVNPNDLHDAKISHKVRRLGFDLEDIRIPQSIADKVQGFRIYYAKRKHSDRTILGQAPLIPAMYKNSRLGMCQEAAEVPESAQVLSTLQSIPENFYNMDPYARNWNTYPVLPFNLAGSSAVTVKTDQSAMNVFSFHDFYLLRTKNSLASATHITVEYGVQNFAFNGPALNQNKKMVTILTDAGGSEPLEVKEQWGWDATQNCYPREMASTILIGARYKPPYELTQPRLIGQKAKTYLLGDSIFKGDSLGFGGKLFNEFGESCIAFKLMDNHALSAFAYRSLPISDWIGYFAQTYGDGSSGNGGASELEFGYYGVPSQSFSILTTTMTSTGKWGNYTNSTHHHGLRSQSIIANLKAFKTDVYKSIDSQDLVWTGFEVLGDNLQNFVFASDGTTYGTGKTKTHYPDGIYGGDTFICRYGITTSLKPSNIESPANPEKAIHHHIVESTDNINFRHTEDDNSMYFPNGVAKAILREAGPKDFHHVDNMKYNKNYSENNDIRPAFPLPLRDTVQDDFPTRTHRSAKHDTTSIIDNYRIFLANQYKDLPKNRGDLWKLSSFNNLLYFHMRESLYASKGKQSMQMKDGSEAFVGSGDIFVQEPDELVQTEGGFGGTQSQWAALTTRFGYFFVDANSKKVFLMKDQLSEISSLGMSKWFEDNLGFALTAYGYPGNRDNPLIGLGFTSVYDPKHKRIILTKRDLGPTQAFRDGYYTAISNASNITSGTIRWNYNGMSDPPKFERYGTIVSGTFPNTTTAVGWSTIEWDNNYFFTEEKGWTISYYPELGVWGSFHDYIPYIYFNTSTDFYSLTDEFPNPAWTNATVTATHLGTTYGNNAIWRHNSTSNYGMIYQEWYGHTDNIDEEDWLTIVDRKPFEFEFIHNEFKAEDTLLAAFNYTLETFNQAGISVLEHGFTSFFLYNTLQMSGESVLEYFINIRRIGNNWKVNHFRDMADIALENTAGGYYMSTNTNIIGGTNVGTITTSDTENMFDYDGMSKTFNPNYLNLSKNWRLQRKFIDKWVGIRLIYNNVSNNLLNLYTTDVVVRKVHR